MATKKTNANGTQPGKKTAKKAQESKMQVVKIISPDGTERIEFIPVKPVRSARSLDKSPEEAKRRAAAYKAIIKEFSAAYMAQDKDPDRFGRALNDLALASTYGVLNKCFDLEPSEFLRRLKIDVVAGAANFAAIERGNLCDYIFRVNQKGEYVFTFISDDARGLDAIHGVTIGDGYDLVNDASEAILHEVEEQLKRDPDQPVDLERPYEQKMLHGNVRIPGQKSMAWKDKTTCPIRSVYKAIARIIRANKAYHDPENHHLYLDDITIHPITGEPVPVYVRLPVYADIGGNATRNPFARPEDSLLGAKGGSDGMYTADIGYLELIEVFCKVTKLTSLQKRVLSCRLSSVYYGYDAIATYLGISKDTTWGAIREIRRKSFNAGITPGDPLPLELYKLIFDKEGENGLEKA